MWTLPAVSVCHVSNRRVFGGLIFAACDVFIYALRRFPLTSTFDDSTARGVASGGEGGRSFGAAVEER